MHAPTMNAFAQASSTRSLPVIAIAVGDPAGIGPEIALKAALSAETLALCHPVLVGDRGVIETHARLCGITAPLVSVQQARDAVPAGTVALTAARLARCKPMRETLYRRRKRAEA